MTAACGPARAAESLGAGTAGPKPGWQRMSKSLLYYDAEGNLSNEIGLGRWEDASLARVKVKVIDGGTSSDGSFAWTLDKRTTWNSLKTKVLESQHSLRFFDPGGKELWSEEGADSLPGSAPLVFSDDGKTCLLALRRGAGWYALVKTYLGNTLWELGPFPKLEALQISPNGRYGMVSWNDPDKTASRSFLDLQGKVRQDVASDLFLLGKTAVDDQGRAFSGSRQVFSFSAASTAPVAGQGRSSP
ncbi:MAG: hypothetical protein NTY77_20270 [Elusimicrobia bacterium]|nr:hypothetical protein [Elusimicrobiota bacterium]